MLTCDCDWANTTQGKSTNGHKQSFILASVRKLEKNICGSNCNTFRKVNLLFNKQQSNWNAQVDETEIVLMSF